jgi:ankyrin
VESKRIDEGVRKAVLRGDKYKLMSLCEFGAIIHGVDSKGDTALHLAAKRNLPAIATILLVEKLDPSELNREGKTALHLAISGGGRECFDAILQYGAGKVSPWEVPDEHGEYPLQTALRLRKHDMVAALIDKGVILDRVDKQGNNFLHLAAASDYDIDSEQVQGEWVSAKNHEGKTPAQIAFDRGNLRFLSLLSAPARGRAALIGDDDQNVEGVPALETDDDAKDHSGEGRVATFVNLDEVDKNGNTALHRAIMSGNKKMAFYLIDEGADINALNGNAESPVAMALRFKRDFITDYLVHAGCEVEAVDKDGNTFLHLAAINGYKNIPWAMIRRECFLVENNNAMTPVELAVIHNNSELLKGLLRYGRVSSFYYKKELAGAVLQGDKGAIYIYENLERFHDVTQLQVAQELELPSHAEGRAWLLKGIPLEKALFSSGNRLGHLAAEYGSAECLQLLLDCEMPVEITTSKGHTPLHIAARKGNDKCIDVLLQGGADIHKVDLWGLTPLHKACLGGSSKSAAKLLAKGANLEARTRSGSTPLHCAAHQGHNGCIRVIVDRSGNLNAIDWQRQTALMLAAENDKSNTVRLLINCGADPRPLEDANHDMREFVNAAKAIWNHSSAVLREHSGVLMSRAVFTGVNAASEFASIRQSVQAAKDAMRGGCFLRLRYALTSPLRREMKVQGAFREVYGLNLYIDLANLSAVSKSLYRRVRGHDVEVELEGQNSSACGRKAKVAPEGFHPVKGGNRKVVPETPEMVEHRKYKSNVSNGFSLVSLALIQGYLGVETCLFNTRHVLDILSGKEVGNDTSWATRVAGVGAGRNF